MPSVTRIHSSDAEVYINTDRLNAVQSFSYENPKSTTEIRKLGSYKIEDRILNADQPINSTVNFLVTDYILENTANRLDLLSLQTYTLKLVETAGTTTLSNSYLNNYNLNFSVGELAQGSYGFISDSIDADGSSSEFSATSNDFNVFRPQNMTVTTTLDEGINSSDYAIQNCSISIPIQRTSTTRVGSRSPRRRYPVLPAQGTVSFSVIKKNVESVDLSSLVLKKGKLQFDISNTILGSESTYGTLNIDLYDCSLLSINNNNDLDGNATLDFNYTFPISNSAVDYFFSS